MNVLEPVVRYEKLFQNISNTTQLNDLLLSLSKQVADNHAIRTTQNYLYGCQSDLWITGHCEKNQWRFQIDSNSQLVKGMGKIITDCFDLLSHEEISTVNFFTFRRIFAKFPHQKQKSTQLLINKIHNLTGHTS